jgi:hypothetical protein
MSFAGRRDRLFWIALAAWVLPVVAAHAAYCIAAAQHLVPWCLPYLEGCTSISRAARHGPASFVFKALMLPTAFVLALFWKYSSAWLAELAPERRRSRQAMLACGVIGAIFLILYVSFLGVEGTFYQWLRRYGVTVYFSFTVVAQMLLMSQLPGHVAVPLTLRRALVALCLIMLLLGLASIPLRNLFEDRNAAVNAIEWCYALLMSTFFPLAGLAARRTRFRAAGGGASH